MFVDLSLIIRPRALPVADPETYPRYAPISTQQLWYSPSPAPRESLPERLGPVMERVYRRLLSERR
jgi:hypothetical protein